MLDVNTRPMTRLVRLEEEKKNLQSVRTDKLKATAYQPAKIPSG